MFQIYLMYFNAKIILSSFHNSFILFQLYLMYYSEYKFQVYLMHFYIYILLLPQLCFNYTWYTILSNCQVVTTTLFDTLFPFLISNISDVIIYAFFYIQLAFYYICVIFETIFIFQFYLMFCNLTLFHLYLMFYYIFIILPHIFFNSPFGAAVRFFT